MVQGAITINELQSTLSAMKKQLEENTIRIKGLEKENQKLKEKLSLNTAEIISKTIKESVREALGGKKGLEKEMQNKFNRNKRNILKHKILDIVGSRSITIGELKDILVDEQAYCSRATFYRYLDSLVKRNLVQIVEIDEQKIVALTAVEPKIKI
jgi:hypothetical protein